MRFLFLRGVYFYQRFLSPYLPARCRYYPTCSDYALWCLQNKPPFLALLDILLRLLRCNQLFKGGIDYPTRARVGRFCGSQSGVLALRKPHKPSKIEFWLVPKNQKEFYIIKSLV